MSKFESTKAVDLLKTGVCVDDEQEKCSKPNLPEIQTLEEWWNSKVVN